MQVDIKGEEFCVDATILAPLLGLPPEKVPVLMKSRAITSVCERGENDDAGLFRLTFFYDTRRARVSVDTAGNVLRRSSVDLGDRARPQETRRSP
jgi:hypothetical protein